MNAAQVCGPQDWFHGWVSDVGMSYQVMDFSTDLEYLVIGATYPDPYEPDEHFAALLIFSMEEKEPIDYILIDSWQ